ncbi:SPFH domain-containing protein [Halobaculum litoreum]|uniref:SPFH domain-containing protein n=1 Tax=Halobaculum litoreum TaxID=3031998 RepID=UPI0024C29694|nr:SPFH domain-containing protein [Halobaculum sp. DT92]
MDSPGRQFFRSLGRVSASDVSLLDLVPDSGSLQLVLGAGLALLAWALLPMQYALAGTLLVLALVTLVSSVEIVQAYEKRALTVFGANRGLLGPGLHLIPPFVSRTYQFDTRVETIDVPTQEAITEDNSPVTADAVVYVRVVDAERAFLEVDDYRRATALLAQTNLRAAIGDMHLDETLSRRDEINRRIREGLQGPTDDWGVQVEMVEVQEVLPTRVVLDAMEQQTSAERRRRAMILEAQGRRRSAVEAAEGDRAANVLAAQGTKVASVLEAQGDAISTVLRARAAESMGERAIIDKGMETLAAIGRGESTTYVIPQELTSLLGRYGTTLSGSDVVDAAESSGLESLEFAPEDRELLGLDSVDEVLELETDDDGATPIAGGESEYDD